MTLIMTMVIMANLYFGYQQNSDEDLQRLGKEVSFGNIATE